MGPPRRQRRRPLIQRDYSHIDRSLLDAATLDEQVRRSLVDYVSLFKSRGDVLYHMYFIQGCGFDWIEGKLIEPYPDPSPSNFHPMTLGLWDHILEKEAREREIAIQELDHRAVDRSLVEMTKFNNVGDDGKFFYVPNGVSLDYLQGAIEIGETVLKATGIPQIAQELAFLQELAR